MADDYEVGHGKPPRASRWTKGQSGNPRGRPKGSRNFASEFAAELRELTQLRENGRLRTITKQRALAKSLVARGIQGDGTALAHVLKLIAQLQAAEMAPPPDLSMEDEEILAEALQLLTPKGTQP